MNDAHQPQLDAPQLRTLLLTDLCDSTALVERIGDTAAAELFREHDHLVLTLQRQWRGRLIDRSDGLLLLFERPIDGLGFALDYVHCLKDLGDSRGLVLKARAGLHVGEVLTWHNSDEAVSVGAKPMEVEGLAKPMAARLMTLARPGQILLSAVAESLLHRSSRELGERAERLLWKSHGRWRFKGVPTAQEIYEVGEVGITPLRGPKSSSKAWRDIPLWRRPSAVLAELTVLAAIGLGIWLATRPEPAIAFAERDWIVVGDVRNLTNDVDLNEPLQQALRLSLQQSRYVNLVSDKRVHDTLVLMKRPAETQVDRVIGSQIAQRTGAKLLVIPAVENVGGRVRVSAEIVNPSNQETLYSKLEAGVGAKSILGSVDKVALDLRERLGEELSAVSESSIPLEVASTGNLDALKLYSLGQREFGAGHYSRARDYYLRAVELDPKFALAHIGVARCFYYMEDMRAGYDHLKIAIALRAKLPPREQFYLDAWQAQVNDPSNAYERWMQMSNLYPDDFAAAENAGYALEVRGRYDEALKFAKRASSKFADNDIQPLELVGRMYLALGQYNEALRSFQKAREAGLITSAVWEANTLEVLGKGEDALLAWPVRPSFDVAYMDRVSIYIDEGDIGRAKSELEKILSTIPRETTRYRQALVVLANVQYISGKRAESFKVIEAAFNASEKNMNNGADAFSMRSDAMVMASVAALAQRMGDSRFATRASAFIRGVHGLASMPPVDRALVQLDARSELAKRNYAEAARLLRDDMDGTEPYQHHVILAEIYRASDEKTALSNEVKWLLAARGRAYAEFGGCGWCQQSINVMDARRVRLGEAGIRAASP